MGQPLVILGKSARAAAQSAVRVGYDCWCVDLRGDRDLRETPGVTARRCPVDHFPTAMLKMLEQAPRRAPVLLTSPLENHRDFVRAVSFERALLGCGVQTIAEVRNPLALPSLKPIRGIRFCRTRTRASIGQRLGGMIFGAFGRDKHLLKPRASSGGRGISWWTPTTGIDNGHYLQQHIRGQAYSVVFRADGWSCFLLGVVEQLVGEQALGAGGFRTCGAIGPVSLSKTARTALSHLGVQLTQRYDMRGVFSVDAIMDFRGTLWPIEVNPRYPGVGQLIERSGAAPVLSGRGPAAGPSPPTAGSVLWGMAQVLARRDIRTPDLYALFEKDQVADVPAAGVLVKEGEPIGTVFAAGRGRDACFAQLSNMAARVYEHLKQRDEKGGAPGGR